MKRILCLAFLLIAAQDEKPCDLAKTELRHYCDNCKGWPAADQIDKGACRKCKGKVERLETCVKIFWNCPTMHGMPRHHSKDCCDGRTCCRETPSLALVWHACEGCKAMALKKSDLRHLKEKCAGPIRKTCALSGKFPHGGNDE